LARSWRRASDTKKDWMLRRPRDPCPRGRWPDGDDDDEEEEEEIGKCRP
jgi:hypothetical protein